MELVANFASPPELTKFLKTYHPDVIIIDAEMPAMDGISLLEKHINPYNIPTIMLSTRSKVNAVNENQALNLGALEIISKDDTEAICASDQMWDELVKAIRGSAAIDLTAMKKARIKTTANIQSVRCVASANDTGAEVLPQGKPLRRVIAVGASTGGTQALERVLSKLTPTGIPVLVVQHMPAHFTHAFANRLNSLCKLAVKEAKDGAKVQPDEILIAPGGKHLRVVRQGLTVLADVKEGNLVSQHCPSVDVLFSSVSEVFGGASVAVLMTGMGHDGADGMAKLHEKGAFTIAQDEKSSVVFGMPAAAIRKGAVTEVASLDQIAKLISNGLYTSQG
jgi:two-component system chemotaxis response regulator CheB